MYFKSAVPVWADGYTNEKNITCGFRTAFDYKGGTVTLTLASSTYFHVYIDGEHFSFGPARCAHGYFRVDCHDLTKRLGIGRHFIAVEVLGYGINGFDTLEQSVFLQAELCVAGQPIAYTAPDGNFEAFVLKDRVQKVQRYDFQHGFSQYYRLKKNYGRWRIGEDTEMSVSAVKEQGGVLMPRNIPHYNHRKITTDTVIADGSITAGLTEKPYTRDRSVDLVPSVLQGFPENEFECYLSKELEQCESVFSHRNIVEKRESLRLKSGSFSLLRFDTVKSGFITFKMTCEVQSKLIVFYDEILVDGDILPYRQRAVNAITLEAEPGTYCFISADPDDFKYLKFAVLTGECTVSDIGLLELACSVPLDESYKGTDEDLALIYQAAVETFRQNALDLFMDCPGRERAGWLCDSYFTARTEFALTGKNIIERQFLEHFLLPDSFRYLPEGMLPMCYPADHNDGQFIPNWAMWFLLELKEYYGRTKDLSLIEQARNRVDEVLRYFSAFENSDGLLENLQGWIFVEWSDAANYVQDINYPTNFLYAASVEAVGELYHLPELLNKAERIRKIAYEQSFDGTWFRDHAVRRDGVLTVQPQATEVCQYYALVFDKKAISRFSDLAMRMVKEFSLKYSENRSYPEISPINMLPGFSLRLLLLDLMNDSSQLIDEIKGTLLPMCNVTGTLWENFTDFSGCNHGFASAVIPIIQKHDATVERQ